MKTENFKPFYALVSLLFIVVIAQGYFIYDLKKETLSHGESQKVHSILALPSTPYVSNRADPFVQIQKIQEEMMQSFGHFNSIFADDPLFEDAFAHMNISPLSDIKESDNEYTLKINIPGVNKQEIDIKTLENRLTISASSQKNVDTNNSNYIHKGRYLQQFRRSFKLPQNADIDALKSDYKKGVLTISIPKKS